MNSKMNRVKIYSKSGELPRYETENSAGLDLRALLDEPMIIKPMERVLIPTGIFLEIPNGFEGQVRARSGLSIKHGLTMVNGVGTVDSDYRGELKVPMINLGSDVQMIGWLIEDQKICIGEHQLCQRYTSPFTTT